MRASRFCSCAVSVGKHRTMTPHALPFEPMALITLDKLQQCVSGATVHAKMSVARTAARSPLTASSSSHRAGDPVGADLLATEHVAPSSASALRAAGAQLAEADRWSSKESASEWFKQGLPFFVSPKHDGIRLITFTPPTSMRKRGGRTKRPSKTGRAVTSTCFSRHGRPIHNLSWIEPELAMLRALAGDTALALDGELYLHKTPSVAAPKAATTSAVSRQKPKGATAQKKSASSQPATAARASGSAVKSGFLAVNALVTRLRASASLGDSMDDVLQYVDALPAMCLFDVISYNPCSSLKSSLSSSCSSSSTTRGQTGMQKHTSSWVQACESVRREAMDAHGVRSLECLQCIPNITPFSQRVRTLYFLADLLERAMRSPVLCSHFHPVSQSFSDCTARASTSSLVASYKGGHYVKAVPYALVRTLKTVEKKTLPSYVARGYEGVVLRAPNNLYELREKRRGVVRLFVKPLEDQAREALQRARSARAGGALVAPIRARRATPRQLLTCHRFCLDDEMGRQGCGGRGARRASERICRVYTTDPNTVATTGGAGTRKGSSDARPQRAGDDLALDAVDPRVQEESEALDTMATAILAARRARELPPRSFSAAKVLPFQDKEYAVLRPLLKALSTNPRTRPLASIKTDKGTLAFYGLQCLAENGRVFNVSLPKMKMADQQALLKHISSVVKKKGRGDPTSLTGLYVTVKYGALTEHGVPRFGTVKAIRGGKGWFL